MNKRKFSTILSSLLVLALAVSFVTPALAVGAANGSLTADAGDYYYVAPTSPMSTDDNYITASAHRAASPLLGILGVNAVSGFGMVNGSAPDSLAAAQQTAALGIWGSSINSNPDPYYWNYFYNFYAAENGLETVENALLNGAWSGSPTSADTTLIEEFGNISYSIYGRPDILIGCGSQSGDANGYDEQIATVNSFTPDSPYYKEGDETYSPIQVAYATTTIQDMIDSVYAAAAAIKQVEAETGKTTRYGDVMEIAQDYETYVKGTIAYVLEELDAKGLEQKTVAVLTGYDAATGMYTLANSSTLAATSTNRPIEYVMNVSKDLSEETGTTISAADLCAKADAIVCFSGTIENAGDGASSITQDSILESFGESVYDGIILATQPSTLYGMTMNSVENAMGYAYTIAYIYSDILDIDPVEMCAYFYQHFLHVDTAEGLATVIRNNFETVILPEGSTTTLATTYSEAAIEAKLAKGISYWQSNPDKFTDAEFDRCGMRTLYTDVSADAWYYDAVKFVTDAGLFQGTGGTSFSPDTVLNMASLLQVLSRAAGNEDTTVTEGAWYEPVKNWAISVGIVTADSFDAEAAVTREDFILMFYQLASILGGYDMTVTADITGATDYAQLDPSHLTAIAWAVGSGIIQGTDGSTLTINPSAQVDRATVATMLMRYYQNAQ